MSPAPQIGDRHRLAVGRAARRLWPVKTASHLAAAAGASQRSAENWLTGTAMPSADNMASLLRSDAGFEFLCEWMDGAETRWWRAVQLRVRMADLERRSAETRQLLDEMRENDDRPMAVGSITVLHGAR